MQFAARVAQAGNQCLLDVGMNIFQLQAKNHLSLADLVANVIKGRHQGDSLFRADQPHFSQHPRLRLAAQNVVPGQATVERDALGVFHHQLIGGLGEAPAPGFAALFALVY